MKNSILHVLEYFSTFSYPPTTSEVYSFLNIKKSEREFNNELNTLVKKRIILKQNNRLALHKSHFTIYSKRSRHSSMLLSKALPFIHKLAYIPTVKFVGISGSLSMNNTSNEGDVDLFVITSANSIWLTRFIVLVYKYIVMAIQKEIGSKMCFNMFFSEKGLQLPPEKQNEYTAHEILQLRSVVDKDSIYMSFLYSNKWLVRLFPQTKISKQQNNNKKPVLFILQYLDSFFRIIQEWWLNRKGYKWQYNNNQLWLIQDDFEKIAVQANL